MLKLEEQNVAFCTSVAALLSLTFFCSFYHSLMFMGIFKTTAKMCHLLDTPINKKKMYYPDSDLTWQNLEPGWSQKYWNTGLKNNSAGQSSEKKPTHPSNK